MNAKTAEIEDVIRWNAGEMRCGECGSDDIMIPCWCEPARGPGKPTYAEYLDNYLQPREDEPKSVTYCGDCGEYGTGVTDEL
jgi:hypothetical protein